ncbi:hypothetical protein LJC57_07110 [Parabacteroides sp. OttesenSCG-928-G07]|nr:hypothetical protein [Parabacteroides sp. OttesenSCG-928-G21]MDL2278346.1 hypothetical protein [Parabacteroides sp. OttesenSCG-928-G07]
MRKKPTFYAFGQLIRRLWRKNRAGIGGVKSKDGFFVELWLIIITFTAELKKE